MLRKASLVFFALTLVVIAGCAEPPTQQIQEAEKALKDAPPSGWKYGYSSFAAASRNRSR